MMRVLRAADDVRLVRDIRIPMRDGTRLAADLYLPGFDGRTTEARSDVTIASTAGTFDVTIDLVVSTDGAVHATRRWDESIPRRLL